MERYIFDYRKLKGKIVEVFGSQKEFAKAMGINPVSMSKKLTNKAYFSQKEIEKAKEILNLGRGTADTYFFTR